MRKTNIERLLIGFIAVTVSLATFSSCAKKRVLELPEYSSDISDTVDDSSDVNAKDTNEINLNTSESINVNNDPRLEIMEDEDFEMIENIFEDIEWNDGDFNLSYEKHTDGLIFQLNADKTSYSVTGYKGEKEIVVIPSIYSGLPVTAIADQAFYQNQIITSVIIFNGIESIGNEAFRECPDLESVVIPNSVKIIGGSAFSSCETLKKLMLSNTLEQIGSSAFRQCVNLENIMIPDSVVIMGSGVFKKTPFYDNLTWDNEVLYIGKCLVEVGADFNESTYYIKDGTKAIASAAFSCCESLETVIMPNSLTHIGHGAFSGSVLKNLTIPNNIKYIAGEAFNACSIETIVLGRGVEYIGISAFTANEFTTIYYCGSESDRTKIHIDYNMNTDYLNWDFEVWYYYSEKQPTESGNYWHYVDGVPTIW